MLSVGLMSGISMDGIDAALIQTDGKIQVQELGIESLSYDPEFRILLKAAEYCVRSIAGDMTKAENYYQQAIKNYLMNEIKLLPDSIEEKLKSLSHYFHNNKNTPILFSQVIKRSTQLHAKVVKQLLEKVHYKSEQIDVIGYHGQTLFHRPSGKITVQIGDGDLLAELTGIVVVNDFRRRDVEHGGQGAPVAPLYHQALAGRDQKNQIAVVNCGSIANITIINGTTYEDIVGFDTGPGNGLVDQYIKKRTQGKEFMDKNGQYGMQGKVNLAVFTLLYQKSVTVEGKNYFNMIPPKSLDSGNLILIPELDELSLEDACATLEAFTADTIINSISFFRKETPLLWVLSGGGWNNPVIRKELNVRLVKELGSHVKVITADEAGWSSQAMEAQIFAYLAVRSLQNMPISVPSTTRVPEPLSGGHAHVPQNGTTDLVNKLLEINPQVLLGYKSPKHQYAQ